MREIFQMYLDVAGVVVLDVRKIRGGRMAVVVRDLVESRRDRMMARERSERRERVIMEGCWVVEGKVVDGL